MSRGITKPKLAKKDHQYVIQCDTCGHYCSLDRSYNLDSEEHQVGSYLENMECHICRKCVVPRARYCTYCKKRSPIVSLSPDEEAVAIRKLCYDMADLGTKSS